MDGIFFDADGSYQGLNDFASSIVFGESQPVVRDPAEWITRRPRSGPVSQVLFHQKRSIFIWPLVCVALSESGSPDSQTVSPKATMSQEVLAMFAR
jgi:hypothetical protein